MAMQAERGIQRFLRLFNSRRFWDAHEALEDTWRATGSDFYQGLILYASAFVHAQRANAHGLLAQLRKTKSRLRGFRPDYLGFDVDAILEHCQWCENFAARGGLDQEDWPDAVMPPPLTTDRGRFRGDEPELAT